MKKEVLVRGTPNKINKTHEKKSTYQIKDKSHNQHWTKLNKT